MKHPMYLQVENAIEKEKKQKKIQKINIFFAFALACVVSLFFGTGAFIIDLLHNLRIGHPVYYIVFLVLIIVVLVSFAIYAFRNNDFSASEEEVMTRARQRRQDLSVFKAYGREDYDSIKDFVVQSKEQLQEIIDGLYDMDSLYKDEFYMNTTNSPPVEIPEAVVTKHTRRDVLTRAQKREQPVLKPQSLD